MFTWARPLRRLPCVSQYFIGLILVLGTITLLASPAQGAGILDLAWDAPTTNVDGTALTDLASYNVYVGTSGAPCPGSSYQQIPSPTADPASGEVVTSRVTGLTTGATYYVQVTAVDSSGNRDSSMPIGDTIASNPTNSRTPSSAEMR